MTAACRALVAAMKRSFEGDSSSAEIDEERAFENAIASSGTTLNPWTNKPYSSRYYEILAKRKQLPVYEFKEALERTVRENQVVIIEGETGSGRCSFFLISTVLTARSSLM